MLYQLLVKAAGAMPKLPAGQTKFSGAQLHVRIHAPVTKTAKQADFRLAVLSPRNIPTLRRPQHVVIEFTVEQQVNRIKPNRRISIGAENPRRLRASNANVLRVIFEQVYVSVLTDSLVNL